MLLKQIKEIELIEIVGIGYEIFNSGLELKASITRGLYIVTEKESEIHELEIC